MCQGVTTILQCISLVVVRGEACFIQLYSVKFMVEAANLSHNIHFCGCLKQSVFIVVMTDLLFHHTSTDPFAVFFSFPSYKKLYIFDLSPTNSDGGIPAHSSFIFSNTFFDCAV